MSHVGAANDANDETIQSEVRPKILTSSSKEFRLLRVEIFLVPQESVRPMPLKPCQRVHHAEVVERVLFVTRNSLKSHKERKLLSPVSNTCAITPKLCTHSRPTAFERTPHLPRTPSRDFLLWRFANAGPGVRGAVVMGRWPSNSVGFSMIRDGSPWMKARQCTRPRHDERCPHGRYAYRMADRTERSSLRVVIFPADGADGHDQPAHRTSGRAAACHFHGQILPADSLRPVLFRGDLDHAAHWPAHYSCGFAGRLSAGPLDGANPWSHRLCNADDDRANSDADGHRCPHLCLDGAAVGQGRDQPDPHRPRPNFEAAAADVQRVHNHPLPDAYLCPLYGSDLGRCHRTDRRAAGTCGAESRGLAPEGFP